MNICPYCGQEFEINPFGNGGKNRIYCYRCFPEGLNRQDRNKIRDYLNTAIILRDKIQRGCDICGYNKNATALEWHHPNDDKIYNPSSLLQNEKIEEYRKEINKCVLLCANCHREIHHPNFDKDLLLNSINSSLQQVLSNYSDYINDNNTYKQITQDILNYYRKVRSVKKTALHFNCDSNTVSKILKRNNQKICRTYNNNCVAMMDLDNNIIQKFDSIKDAYRYLDKQQGGHIAAVCNGERKTAYGYKWKYI